MSAEPLSAEEIAALPTLTPLESRLLATIRAREADVGVRDNDIFAAHRAIGAPQTVELHAAVDALRRERDQARAESRVYAAAPRHRDIEILRACEERGRTEAETIDALLGHLLGVASQRDYLRRREADIIEACERVADGGQYRTDIVAAIQRLRRERDEARADVERLHKATGMDGPWPLPSVLGKLADAADHLLDAHDCDSHGWEEVDRARSRAREILRALDHDAPVGT